MNMAVGDSGLVLKMTSDNKSLQLSPCAASDLKNGFRKCGQFGLMRRRN